MLHNYVLKMIYARACNVGRINLAKAATKEHEIDYMLTIPGALKHDCIFKHMLHAMQPRIGMKEKSREFLVKLLHKFKVGSYAKYVKLAQMMHVARHEDKPELREMWRHYRNALRDFTEKYVKYADMHHNITYNNIPQYVEYHYPEIAWDIQTYIRIFDKYDAVVKLIVNVVKCYNMCGIPPEWNYVPWKYVLMQISKDHVLRNQIHSIAQRFM